MGSTTQSIRVALFQNIVAHYRQALLRELENIPAIELHLFADTCVDGQDIPVVDPSAHPRFHRTQCRRILRATWQLGAVREAATGKFDVYVFMGDASWLSTWVGALVARARGCRVLFWTHGWTRRDHGLKKLARVLFYRLADGLLLYGEHGKRMGVESGFAPRALHVVYNSLDFEHQQALSASTSRTDIQNTCQRLFGITEVPVVLATARLTSSKRFDMLIRACALARKDRPTLHLLVVGDGPEKAALEQLAKDCKVPAAFVGACYDESTLAQYFACANVTVSPGNIGLTCIHSMGYGVPVITHGDAEHQGPEWEAVVPGLTGTLVRQGSVEDLAQAIVEWTTTAGTTEQTRDACLNAIRDRYHPRVQARLLSEAMLGGSADNASYQPEERRPSSAVPGDST